jgi:hypothetical protein
MEPKQLDPLKRVFVPVEKAGVFRTSDNETYQRRPDGSIHRVYRKVKGKAARRAERKARRLMREAIA